MTTRRWAPAPVAVAAITAIRITLTILIIARIAPTAVTITTVAMVAVVTTITTFAAVVRITMGRPAVSHIFARRRSMRAISYGIIDTDPATIQVLSMKIRSREISSLVTKRTHNPV
jgi:hypothetical protein